MKRTDFFRLSWAAWVQEFTDELILSAFKHGGMIPFNPNVILDKFAMKEVWGETADCRPRPLPLQHVQRPPEPHLRPPNVRVISAEYVRQTGAYVRIDSALKQR